MQSKIYKHKKLLTVIASLAILLVLVSIYFTPKPQPSTEQLEKMSKDTIIELTQDQEKFKLIPYLTYYEQTYSDMCSAGEHSWKRNESYNNLCVYRLTYYYGIDANSQLKQVLLDTEKKLADTGWIIISSNPQRPSISEILNTYPESQWFSHLHESEYRKTYQVHLNINTFKGIYAGYDWTTQTEEPNPFGFGVASYQIFHNKQSNQSLKEISEKIVSNNQKPIMISISKEYFKN